MEMYYRGYVISPEFLIISIVRLYPPNDTKNLALLMNILILSECCLLIHEDVLELKNKNLQNNYIFNNCFQPDTLKI